MYPHIPIDIFKKIIEYIKYDINSIANLSECNKYLYKLCRENWVWEDFYRSLFKPKYIITSKSKHIGPVTYFKCQVGSYPGWDNVHTELNLICNNPLHYTNIELCNKNFRWKNLFKMCAKRKYTLDKKKIKWSPIDEHKLTVAKIKYNIYKKELIRLKKKKETYNNFLEKFSNLEYCT